MDPSVLDDIIRRLLDVRSRPGKQVQLTELEVRQLCTVSRDIFKKQPCLLELEAPIKIVGDIHGHYSDLLRLFEYGGFPPEFNYLFLGNYVDYGKQSLETMWLLLAYKIKYPENFFLLRGNHECASITRIYGFYDECKRRFNVRLWKTFIDCFNCLPVAALIDDKIFCVHGGLSPDLHNLDQIRNIRRPTDVPDAGLLCDLLWSDPSMDVQGWGMNDRGVSYTFGAEKVTEFLDKHGLDLFCRSHQIVEDGYEFFANRQLVTLFSAPNYRGEYDNAAAIMSIDETLMCTFQLLKPAERRPIFSSGSSGSTTQPGSSSGANLFSNTTSKFEDEVAPVNKPAERMKNSYFKSRPSANKSESTSAGVKPSGSTVSANFRSNSPGFKLPESTKKPGSGSCNATKSAENPPGINLVKFNFDPNSLYRSKSPGVKRFLGARV